MIFQKTKKPVIRINGVEYKLLEPLGEGATATVYRAKLADAPEKPIDLEIPDDTSNLRAIKIFKPEISSEVIRNLLSNDLNTWEKLKKSPYYSSARKHVVEIHAIDLSSGAMVMEYIPGHTLKSDLEKGTLKSSLDVAQKLMEIAEALSWIHKMGFVYNDLKSENIVVVKTPVIGKPRLIEESIKIIDLGSVSSLTNCYPTSGTPLSMSPELAHNAYAYYYGGITSPSYKSIMFSSDVYSLATLGYEMLLKNEVYFELFLNNETDQQKFLKLRSLGLPITQTYGDELKRELKRSSNSQKLRTLSELNESDLVFGIDMHAFEILNLLFKCLNLDPDSRPTAAEVRKKFADVLTEANAPRSRSISSPHDDILSPELSGVMRGLVQNTDHLNESMELNAVAGGFGDDIGTNDLPVVPAVAISENKTPPHKSPQSPPKPLPKVESFGFDGDEDLEIEIG